MIKSVTILRIQTSRARLKARCENNCIVFHYYTLFLENISDGKQNSYMEKCNAERSDYSTESKGMDDSKACGAFEREDP